jgi:hypothetical protein
VNAAFENTEANVGESTERHSGDTVIVKVPPPSSDELNNHTSPTLEKKSNGVEKTPIPSSETKPQDVAEAVNLELVNMQPYSNSIPVKKESTELDMGDPYDEYFVPVNQHKKYMRYLN